MFPYLAHLNRLSDELLPPVTKSQSVVTNCQFWEAQEREFMTICHAAFYFSQGDMGELYRGFPEGRPVYRDFGALCSWAKFEEQRLKDLGLWEAPRVPSPPKTKAPEPAKGELIETWIKREGRWFVQRAPVGGTILKSEPLRGCPGHDPIRARETGPRPGDWNPESD